MTASSIHLTQQALSREISATWLGPRLYNPLHPWYNKDVNWTLWSLGALAPLTFIDIPIQAQARKRVMSLTSIGRHLSPGQQARRRFTARLKKGATVTAVSSLIAAGMIVGGAGALTASAHVPTASLTCSTAKVDLSTYDAPATATVVLDDTTVQSGTFGGEYHLNQALDPTVNHKLVVTVDSTQGTDGTQYDYNQTFTVNDCVPPFNYDWQYAAPTCAALTVVYPGNIPAGQANDANVQIKNLDTNATVTLNFHNNTGTWSGTKAFVFTDNPNWPGWSHYAVIWTQVAGTNYHWTGSVECGTPPPPTPKLATADFTVGQPSCSADATVSGYTVSDGVTHGEPTYSDGVASVTFTAPEGSEFNNGSGTITVTHPYANKLPTQSTNPQGGCYLPPPLVTHDQHTTVDCASGQTTVVSTITTTEYVLRDGVVVALPPVTVADSILVRPATQDELIGATCLAVVVTPPAPVPTPPTCTAGGKLPTVTDGDTYTASWDVLSDTPGVHTVTYTAKAGNVFADKSTTVSYPITVQAQLTVGCAKTTSTPPTSPTPPKALAFTGSDEGNVALAGLAFLLVGGLFLVRRRKAPSAE